MLLEIRAAGLDSFALTVYMMAFSAGICSPTFSELTAKHGALYIVAPCVYFANAGHCCSSTSASRCICLYRFVCLFVGCLKTKESVLQLLMGWTTQEMGFNSRQRKRFFCSVQRPVWLWSPRASYPMGTGGFLPGNKQAGA